MADRVLLDQESFNQVHKLVRQFGLRPMVDAVGAAALRLVQAGETVKDEYGEAMDSEDVEVAADNLTNGDLY